MIAGPYSRCYPMNFPDVTEEAARRAQSLADQAYTMSKAGNVWSDKI